MAQGACQDSKQVEETEGVPGENSSAIAQGTLNIYCHVLVLLLVRQ